MAEQLISTITVEAADGRRWRAHEYGQLVARRPLAGRAHNVLGASRFALDDGRHLNPVRGDPEAFQIFDTDEIVRKVR